MAKQRKSAPKKGAKKGAKVSRKKSIVVAMGATPSDARNEARRALALKFKTHEVVEVIKNEDGSEREFVRKMNPAERNAERRALAAQFKQRNAE